MKIITIFLVLFINTAWGQTYPCVPDSLIMNWLNSQNSYHFSQGNDIAVEYFDLAGVGDAIDFPKYSYQTNCLSPTAKAKILSLLKGEDYDFKEELDLKRTEYYGPKSDWAESRLKWNFKGDTTRLAEKLDSLYQPMRAEQLASLKAGEYSKELIRFIGLIYFNDAIPLLKAELKSPNRYAETQEFIQQTLARMGDKYWINYYIKKFQQPSKEYHEFDNRYIAVAYINNPKIFQTFLRTELNNNIIGDVHYSDYTISSPMWQKVIDKFVGQFRLDKSYRETFGETLYDKFQKKEDIHTKKIKNGILEILEKCKYDCLVDYSQKPRK